MCTNIRHQDTGPTLLLPINGIHLATLIIYISLIMNKNLFITIEGIEGVGKTTQIKLLEAYLKGKGISFISTREPGGTQVCEKIRNILLHDEMDPVTELMLYEAARAEHFSTVIEPALKDNRTVICDRFADASIAYQGYGRGVDIKLIETLNEIATKQTKPDLTIVLDMDLDQASERLRKRGTEPDKFERLDKEFYKKVRKGYLDLAVKEPERVKIINSLQSIEKVHQDIVSVIKY